MTAFSRRSEFQWVGNIVDGAGRVTAGTDAFRRAGYGKGFHAVVLQPAEIVVAPPRTSSRAQA